MKYLYDLGIWAYQFIIFLISPFNKKAKLLYQGRQKTFRILTEKLAENTSPVAWFHTASLGEFEQGRPVIEAFKNEFPTYKIVLTFFSPSGYEIRKNYPQADVICYLPADTQHHAQKFMQLLEPQVVFFVKYEFWHHFIRQAKRQNVPLISFSAIFREKQIYFKSYGQFFQNILRDFTHFFVQNEKSKNLLQTIAIQQVSIAGDTRFDRVKTICDARKNIPIARYFAEGQKVLIIGSSWAEDLEVIAPVLDSISDLKLIIAPHQISENSLRLTENYFPTKQTIRYSKANLKIVQKYDILLIDNIGMLTSLYQYGTVAYVGGAFGKGLHNVLEAAVFGLPVFCGVKYTKFREVVDLVALGGVFSCENRSDFAEKFDKIWHNPTFREQVGMICTNYITQNIGASTQIIEFIKKNIIT